MCMWPRDRGKDKQAQTCWHFSGLRFVTFAIIPLGHEWASQGALVVKKSPVHERFRFDPWVGKIPWRRAQ